MRVVRVGLPALAGCLVLLFGLQSVSSGLQSGSTGLPGIDPPAISSEIQVGILPIGIGIVLLLAAVAIARRTRLGYRLGLLVGALMAVAGLGLIVTEIPFLQKGGLGGAIGGGIVVLAIAWTILWLAYAWRFSKASSDFEPAWTPSDRRMALVITAIVLVSAVAFLGLGALQANATADAIENDAQARAAVEATTLEVLVLDFRVAPASATRAAVNHLTLDLVLRNPQAYAITVSPTLCLTSRAIFDDPGYKQGMLCWGIPDPEDSLRSTFSGLRVQQDTTMIRLDFAGAGSPCPMSPGAWNAELTIQPALANGDPAGGSYSIDAPFFVPDDSIPQPPSGAPDASDGCISVSP